jgi:hypothetical protein
MPFFGGGGGAAGIGGSTGATDNAILRADGTGAATLQNSDLNIDDASTSTQNNVAITNQHSGQTNSALVLTPKGTGALIAGAKPDGTTTGGNARGSRAVDLQPLRTNAARVASGSNSTISGGSENTASGEGSFVGGGNGNTASGGATGYGAVVGGQTNQATGNGWAFAGGGLENIASGNVSGVPSGYANTASGDSSFCVGGRQALANRWGMAAQSAGQFAAQGDAQRAFFVLRCKTTTNSAVEMGLNGSTTYLTIPSGKVIFCNIKVVGVKSDGSVVATYERQYAAKNVAGTSSEVFAAVTIGTDNASSTSLAVATVDAGDYISIKPTGIASETWRWVASVDAVEVAYGT